MSFHVIPCHALESWGPIYLHAMRIMPCHATCYHMCYDIMHTSCSVCTQASQPPLSIYGAL